MSKYISTYGKHKMHFTTSEIYKHEQLINVCDISKNIKVEIKVLKSYAFNLN